MILRNFIAFLNRRNVPENVYLYVEPAIFQELSVHITLELAFLKIKAFYLLLNWLMFDASRMVQTIVGGRLVRKIY